MWFPQSFRKFMKDLDFRFFWPPWERGLEHQVSYLIHVCILAINATPCTLKRCSVRCVRLNWTKMTDQPTMAFRIWNILEALGSFDWLLWNIRKMAIRRYPQRNICLEIYACNILTTQVTCDINGKESFTNQPCSFVLQLIRLMVPQTTKFISIPVDLHYTKSHESLCSCKSGKPDITGSMRKTDYSF